MQNRVGLEVKLAGDEAVIERQGDQPGPQTPPLERPQTVEQGSRPRGLEDIMIACAGILGLFQL